MGTRAIPASRLLASHAEVLKAYFTSEGLQVAGEKALLDPLIVFSPSMYLPAVIAKAESLAKFVFGSADVLGVRRSVNDLGVLGVEADVKAVDGSPEGVLRGLLLARASEQVFDMNLLFGKSQLIDVARITAYYRGEGAAAVRGERDDVISADVTSSYEWNQR